MFASILCVPPLITWPQPVKNPAAGGMLICKGLRSYSPVWSIERESVNKLPDTVCPEAGKGTAKVCMVCSSCNSAQVIQVAGRDEQAASFAYARRRLFARGA